MGVFETVANYLKPKPRIKRKPREWSHEPERRLSKERKAIVDQYEPTYNGPKALHYKPKLTGAGGEHFVFEIAESPDVVVKVEKTAVRDALVWKKEHKIPAAKETGESRKRLEERVAEQRRIYAALKKHFGANHILGQKKIIMSVPLTPGMKREIGQMIQDHIGQDGKREEYDPPDLRMVSTIVTVQRKAKELDGARYLPLQAGSLEKRIFEDLVKKPKLREAYQKVTEPLMNATTAKQYPFDEEEWISLLGHPRFAQLADRAIGDPRLRKTLRDFCERAIAFAEETDEIIDFVGVDNVIFSQKPNGEWTYLLIDPLYGFDTQVLEKGKAAYLKARATGELTDQGANAYLQGVNFVRAINGLAKVTGSTKVYNYLPLEAGQPPDVLGVISPKLKHAPARQTGAAA